MTKRQTRQYEMLVRVRDFGHTYRQQFAEESEGSKAFGVVADAVGQIDTFHKSKLTARRESMQTKQKAKAALAAQIGAIARSARVMAKAIPDADAKFPLPARRSDVAVLQSGRLFLDEAAAVKDMFIRCGLPPTFIDELQQAVAAFEQAISGCTAGRTGAVVSRGAIHSALKRGVDAVDTLDVLVANTVGHDEHAMRRWKRDRHVAAAGRNASAGTPLEQPAPAPAEEPPTALTTEPPSPQATVVSANDHPLQRAS